MNSKVKKAVEEYQCPGCYYGSDVSCYKEGNGHIGCGKHEAGTFGFPIVGGLFLGLPNGFNRIGQSKLFYNDFEKYDIEENWTGKGHEKSKFNIVGWKYLDKNGNTIVRGLRPRINALFVQTYHENCLDKFDGYEIPTEEIENIEFKEPDKNFYLKVEIFEKFEPVKADYGKYNIVCWKHTNKHGHTLVRGFRPLTSETFLHIYLEPCIILGGINISSQEIDEMD